MLATNYIETERTSPRYTVAFFAGDTKTPDVWKVLDLKTFSLVKFDDVDFESHVESAAVLMCRQLNSLKNV